MPAPKATFRLLFDDDDDGDGEADEDGDSMLVGSEVAFGSVGAAVCDAPEPEVGADEPLLQGGRM